MGHTDRQTDGRTDRQTDRPTDRRNAMRNAVSWREGPLAKRGIKINILRISI